MAFYLFNVSGERGDEDGLREHVASLLRARRWPVEDNERHLDALGAGDLALVYIGPPLREFWGCVELASAVEAWSDGQGVALARVDWWGPAVPVEAVLERVDKSAGARAEFDTGVLAITEAEYTTTLALAPSR